jgi:hypothetical protein
LTKALELPHPTEIRRGVTSESFAERAPASLDEIRTPATSDKLAFQR